MGLFDSPEEREQKKKLKEEEKERKRKLFEKIMASNPEVSTKPRLTRKVESDNVVHCSKCGSTSITADKKGFSLGKGVVGTAVSMGNVGVGAVTGMMGKNKIYITCLNCGHKWKPGGK